MFDFATIDWFAILKIIGIDIMLGVDNAIVIALACASLPLALRTKGVFYGTAGAVVLRGILLACVGLLMGLPYIQVIAGAYLVDIGYKRLVDSDGDGEHDINESTSLWGAIQTIIVADFMMSLDNVMAVAGAAQSAGEHATIYAVLGIIFSIPVIILGASVIMKLMDRFPIIIWIGAGLLGWVGAEMIVSDSFMAQYVTHDQHIYAKIAGFVLVIGSVYLVQMFSKKEEV